MEINTCLLRDSSFSKHSKGTVIAVGERKKNKDHFYSNIYGMPDNKAIMTEILSFEYLKAILLVYSYEFKKYKF